MRHTSWVLLLLITACREGAETFRPPDPFEGLNEAPARLTFNPNDDRTPVWAANSDSVYFTAESYPPFARTRGLILSAPRMGGTATVIMRPVQVGVGTQPLLTAPMASRDGSALAFFEMREPAIYDCINDFCPTAPTEQFARPELVRAHLRVRQLEDASANDVARFTLDFQGWARDPTRRPFNLNYVTVIVAHPFQRMWSMARSPLFRASWSPDGNRLVFSDGLQLRLWVVGEATTAIIPNTQDGVWPAWSPDGSTIAFTRLLRGPIQQSECTCFGPRGDINAYYDVTLYGFQQARGGTLTLVRPDGSDVRELGPGEAPTWSPDGNWLVFTLNSTLHRMAPDGSGLTPIPDTTDGFEPAVSPDGRWLAFARQQENGTHDIWVVAF